MVIHLVKNEQWTVNELVAKLNNQNIVKPKYQRKRKWKTLPTDNNNIPNEKDFIIFLFNVANSVHPISFGEERKDVDVKYQNIDGNNRINAIYNFIMNPFDIYPEYLQDLNEYIDKKDDIPEESKDTIKKIFNQMTYKEVLDFNYKKYFQGHEDLYKKYLQSDMRDEIESYIEEIQSKFKRGNSERFDFDVKIPVNIFIGYSTYELCKIFEDINKHGGNLTQMELLASKLYNITGFEIENSVIETKIKLHVKEFYNEKSTGEVLKCYNYIETETLNAYDFITGLELFMIKENEFLKNNNSDQKGLSLFFKLYNSLYQLEKQSFIKENVNEFIDYITYSCDLLNSIIDTLVPEIIDVALYNKKQCKNQKLREINKNNLFILLSAIIGFRKKEEYNNSNIKRDIKKSLLYHFFVTDLQGGDEKSKYNGNSEINKLAYKSGGAWRDQLVKKLYIDPDLIHKAITQQIFTELIDSLIKQNNIVYEYDNKPIRRCSKFHEKILIAELFMNEVPVSVLKSNKFSIEHIIPDSSRWEGKLNKDRLGNRTMVIAKDNSGRKNKHINYYDNKEFKFYPYISNYLFQKRGDYDQIIKHNQGSPHVKDNNLYNAKCEYTEKMYRDGFIKSLYS